MRAAADDFRRAHRLQPPSLSPGGGGAVAKAATAAPGSQVQKGGSRSASESALRGGAAAHARLAHPLRGTGTVSYPLFVFQSDPESGDGRQLAPRRCSGYSGKSRGPRFWTYSLGAVALSVPWDFFLFFF